MKIRCPNCQALSEVDDSKIPKQGAWGRCPKCGERIRIGPSGETAPGGIGKDTKLAEDELDFGPPVTVETDTGSRTGCIILLVFLFILSTTVGYIGLKGIDWGEEDDQIAQPAGKQAEEVEEIYTEEQFVLDLKEIRRKLNTRNYTPYMATFYAAEFRVLEHLADDCGLDCPYVWKAEIQPFPDRTGFAAEYLCGDHGDYSVEFRWSHTFHKHDCP